MDSKEGSDALFLYATEGILVVDTTGEIIRINPSGERLFGYEKGELLGQKIEVLIPQKYSAHQTHREKFNQHPHARAMGAGMDLNGLRKDKTEFPVEISLSPFSTPQGDFVIAFIVDITLRKENEEQLKNYSFELESQVRNRTLILEEAIAELEKTIAELEKTKKELHASLEKEKELNELKSRFVSMASHEFRTPLATILSSLALVKKYGDLDDKEKQDKHILRIKSSITTLTDILNDFLSVSKLEESKVENNPEVFDLREFMEDVLSEMQPLAVTDQRIRYTHKGGSTARLDKRHLKNILFNLISNAIKYSPEDTTVEVTADVGDHEISVSVRDHGMGISEEDQKHLFGRFFRGANATHIQGTGLGLNIVWKFAELMNGTVAFESKIDKGSTFTVTLPQ